MKKLVFFPSDPIIAYIQKGRSYDFLDSYYNPGSFFDEVYCLSPWGEKEEETIGKIHYIKASPYRFSSIIKKIQPDVVRGYGGYCCADWVSFNKVKGIPTVVSVHDTNPELIHDSLLYADEIICMSHAVKKAVLDLVRGINPNVIYVMPNRIDIDLFSKKNNLVFFEFMNQKYGKGKHILHIGRKTEQKNLDTVIRALKYLDDDVSCIFVGQGDTNYYYNLAKNEHVEERCFWVNRVDNDELPLWHSWSDCMCTPSRWEGFGYVFIEAAACENLVVTSNIAPMNEYLIDGKNAILVDDYENPVALAAILNTALQGGERIESIKKQARNVGLMFSKDKIDQIEIELYKRAMNIVPNNRNNDMLLAKLKFIENKEIINQKVHQFIHRLCSPCKHLVKNIWNNI